MQRTCVFCGEVIEGNGEFCGFCGKQQPQQPTTYGTAKLADENASTPNQTPPVADGATMAIPSVQPRPADPVSPYAPPAYPNANQPQNPYGYDKQHLSQYNQPPPNYQGYPNSGNQPNYPPYPNAGNQPPYPPQGMPNYPPSQPVQGGSNKMLYIIGGIVLLALIGLGAFFALRGKDTTVKTSPTAPATSIAGNKTATPQKDKEPTATTESGGDTTTTPKGSDKPLAQGISDAPGRLIFFSKSSNSMAIAPASGGGSVKLPYEFPIGATDPYSPDGTKYVDFKNKNNGSVIIVGASDGSSSEEVTTLADTFPSNVSWSPDSKKLAIVIGKPDDRTASNLFVLNLETKELRQLSQGGRVSDDYIRWSPDGQKISFLQDTGADRIHVVNVDGSNDQELFESWTGAVWSADGKLLYDGECTGKPFVTKICSMDLETKAVEVWADLGDYSIDSISPDYKWLLMNDFLNNSMAVYNIETKQLEKLDIPMKDGKPLDLYWSVFSPDMKYITLLDYDNERTLAYKLGSNEPLRILIEETILGWSP